MSENSIISKESLSKWRLNYYKSTPLEELLDSFKGKIVVLAGIPGSGKSTLGEQLAKITNGVYFPEYVQSDLLSLYIEEQVKYGFSFQIVMAHKRISIYKEAITAAESGKAVFVDGPLICDNAFADMLWIKGLISDKEYYVYQRCMNDEVTQKLRKPDYMVYLDCTVEVALNRIKRRGRPGEHEAYSKDRYLHKLTDAFRKVFEGVKVNMFDYNEEICDEAGIIPDKRLFEILGLVRDGTFVRYGLSH